MRDRRKAGISPVVATVILVAVAIVIAIAVAFWASGLVGVFTRFEKIEIVSAYFDPGDPADPNDDAVVVIAKNSGSSPAVVDQVFVNGVPCTNVNHGPTRAGAIQNLPANLGIGNSEYFVLQGGPDACFRTGGVTNEVALHSTSGKTYPVAVLVP
ncbi:MAG: hypothetical protein NYU90_04950 [Aigarchaeota archaeon]|nr:hypothetical protein [Candidatus Calditenuis fumarioli]